MHCLLVIVVYGTPESVTVLWHLRNIIVILLLLLFFLFLSVYTSLLLLLLSLPRYLFNFGYKICVAVAHF